MSSQTQIIELTENDFDAQVLDSHKPVLIDFWAPWCQPCLMLAPTIKQQAEPPIQITSGSRTDSTTWRTRGLSGTPAPALWT